MTLVNNVLLYIVKMWYNVYHIFSIYSEFVIFGRLR